MPHFYETIPEPPEMPHHYDTISDPHYETISDKGIYSKGKPADLMKYDWYHGNITEEQAEIAISTGYNNRFLVRHSDLSLILSKSIAGWKSHDIIHRSPEGYRLEGKEKVFKTVPEMIAYYKLFPIKEDQVLGKTVKKVLPGINNCFILTYSLDWAYCTRILEPNSKLFLVVHYMYVLL